MPELKDYYLELTSKVCDGLTPDHYDRWLKWAKENGLLISPWMFISSIASLSVVEVPKRILLWHMEHGKSPVLLLSEVRKIMKNPIII